ncbi:fluoride efflux transporter FluC [Candidatus Corynebacterium faecigallinarum]
MIGEISLVAALLVAFGGGTGAWLRWRLDRYITDRTSSDLLVSLLVINTLGSLVLGLLFGLTDSWWLVALIGRPMRWLHHLLHGVGRCRGPVPAQTHRRRADIGGGDGAADRRRLRAGLLRGELDLARPPRYRAGPRGVYTAV